MSSKHNNITKKYTILLMICISMKGIKVCLLNLNLLISQHNNILINLVKVSISEFEISTKEGQQNRAKKGRIKKYKIVGRC